MLIIGIILLLIGAGVAALLDRTIGLIIAGIGALVILIPLLTEAAGEDAGVLRLF